jgi:hypothetical protein
MTLTEFLGARLDEYEAAARASYYEGQRWITEEEGVYRWPDDELVHSADRKADARHIALHDPARVLQEVEADRQLLAKYRVALLLLPGKYKLGYCEAYEEVLQIRAARFADHPDYDEAWRP